MVKRLPAASAGEPPPSDHEAALAEVVSGLADRLQAGEQLDFQQVCAAYPQFEGELSELWGMLVLTEAAAATARSSQLPGEPGEPGELEGHGAGQSAVAEPAGASGSLAAAVPAAAPVVPRLPFEIGDYQLLEVIGRGGMGVVYRARQLSLNRLVAVKMIQENRPSTDENRKRFMAEAEATARLEHPGIVPVYEVSQFQGQPFFSMQFVRGQTLADRLKLGPLPQRAAARIMVDVCRAIDFAHQQGVLHRDIKPSNIMLDAQDQVRVTDFGLAKFADSTDSLTRTGAVIGTPSYMSPEQATGRSHLLGPRSDVYSLGSVLYHALTGRPPFVADSPVQLALQVLEHEPPLPRLLEPGIDRDLEMIVQRCIQKPPDLRYATAGEVADDLECFLRDEPVKARSGKFGQVLARWFRETHHAAVLENWGLLWMWHSLVLLLVSLATEGLHWSGVTSRLSYSGLWVVGLGTWAAVFWALRRRMGPVTFVERQIAHVWGASLLAIAALTPLEWLLQLPPLTLSPVLGLVSAMMFVIKAGILAGWFYLQAAGLILTSLAMALFPHVAHIMFGVVSAGCFFIPGLKYYRQRQRTENWRATAHSV